MSYLRLALTRIRPQLQYGKIIAESSSLLLSASMRLALHLLFFLAGAVNVLTV